MRLCKWREVVGFLWRLGRYGDQLRPSNRTILSNFDSADCVGANNLHNPVRTTKKSPRRLFLRLWLVYWTRASYRFSPSSREDIDLHRGVSAREGVKSCVTGAALRRHGRPSQFDQLGPHFGSTNHRMAFGVATSSTHNHQPMKRWRVWGPFK